MPVILVLKRWFNNYNRNLIEHIKMIFLTMCMQWQYIGVDPNSYPKPEHGYKSVHVLVICRINDFVREVAVCLVMLSITA
jgi:ppGpp synthetase/RelA/SpoT-type nucleotidyltranferase